MWKLVEEQDFYLFFKLGLEIQWNPISVAPPAPPAHNFLLKLFDFNWQGQRVDRLTGNIGN